MHYLALLFSPAAVPGSTLGEEYRKFEEWAGDRLAYGAALHPADEAVTVRGGDAAPVITDGPYTEAAEIVNGFWVVEADDLDEALEIARRMPPAKRGGVELWPMVEWQSAPDDGTANRWIALLRNPGGAKAPDTAEWETGAQKHVKFAEAAGDALRGGGALHPAGAATTVRAKDGEMVLSDGPYTETNEIVNGVYVIAASTKDEAAKLAAQIPMPADGVVELRKVVTFAAA